METTVKEKEGFWENNWDNVIIAIISVAIVGLIAWFVISFFVDKRNEDARIEASKFEINGTIENVREEHRVDKVNALLFDSSELRELMFVKIGGVEYEVNVRLTDLDFLTTGQQVKASGAEGQIDAVSISK